MADVYGYLGPAGTYAEAALLAAASTDSAELVPFATVPAALAAVRGGEVDAAMIPLENSVEGAVAAAVDGLAVGDRSLVIAQEIRLPVTFCLASVAGRELAQVRKVAAHPHAEAQTRAWLATHMPQATVVPAASNAAAAIDVVEEQPHAEAAVTSPFAAEVYGLEVLAEDIGDTAGAETRFVLVRPAGPPPAPTGADTTTLALFMGDDHPGALLEILTEFAVRGINLTRIESRPTGGRLGSYFFSVDAEGHLLDERMGEALMGLRRVCQDVRYLGSYARSDGATPTLTRRVRDEDYTSARQWLRGLRAD